MLICTDNYAGKQHCPVCGDKNLSDSDHGRPQCDIFSGFSILASQRISPQLLNKDGNPASLSVAIVTNHKFKITHWFLSQGACSAWEGSVGLNMLETAQALRKAEPSARAGPPQGALRLVTWALIYQMCPDVLNVLGTQSSACAQDCFS